MHPDIKTRNSREKLQIIALGDEEFSQTLEVSTNKVTSLPLEMLKLKQKDHHRGVCKARTPLYFEIYHH